MFGYVAKKTLWHLGAGLLVWLLVGAFSAWGRIYAGFAAGFLGACYLLAGWLCWMKAGGTDLMGRIRRQKPPEVPYYLRGVDKADKPRWGIGGNRHTFADEEPEPANLPPEGTAPKAELKGKALSWALAGVLLLLLSAF